MKLNNQFSSIEQVTGQYLSKSKTIERNLETEVSFEEILKSKQEIKTETELKFSKHAANRLADRNIDLTQEKMQRLEKGT